MEALARLRVVDFSRILAGPFATMMLADLGAEVAKVERPGSGDDTRTWGPPFDEAGEATYFQSVNRNKRSVALDLADPGDLERAAELVAERRRRGRELPPRDDGAARARLRDGAARPTPASSTARSPASAAAPAPTLPGYDLLLQALGGLMSITGEPDGEPQKVGVALVDVLAGLFATVGILAALRHRDRTGEGQLVEVDLLSSLLAALVNQASAYTLAGVVPTPDGQRPPEHRPVRALRAADGELVLAVGNDRQFAALCDDARRPRARRRRALRDQRRPGSPHRERAARAARAPARARAPAAEWVEELTAARRPGRDRQRRRRRVRARRAARPRARSSRSPARAAAPPASPRNPIRLSATPADVPQRAAGPARSRIGGRPAPSRRSPR